MKILVMGLGNIALKAYLPLYKQFYPDIKFIYYSRDIKRAQELNSEFQIDFISGSLDNLDLSIFDAVMIHTPTPTHYDLIDFMLDQNLHVFVDKPITDCYDQTLSLYKKAKRLNRTLFVGFNRRYSPLYMEMKSIESPNHFILEKNRKNTIQEKKFALYDMMIHMVDTALYIAEPSDPSEVSIQYKRTYVDKDGNLELALLLLDINDMQFTISINMKAGSRYELVESKGVSGHFRIENMDSIIQIDDETTTELKFKDWDTTLYKRGFKNMLDEFFEILNLDSFYIQKNVILSHYLIEELNKD